MTDQLNLFVPRQPVMDALADIVPGSAIVNADPAHEDTLLIYYEGNVYGASNLHRYSERVRSAAGRLLTRYPTVALRRVPRSGLIYVGAYFPEEAHRIVIVDYVHLEAWLELRGTWAWR